jgi:hypothetical protein
MRRGLAFVIALLALLAGRARGQGLGAEVLATAESWKTDGASRLLSRNDGDPLVDGQLYGWLAYQPSRALRILAIGEIYAISGHENEVDGDVEMLALRWWHDRALRIEAGKILMPIGEFASRRFANTNPLIGAPDTYIGEYPWGAEVSGAIGPVDYAASAVTLPAVNVRYTPAPSGRLRPVVTLGISAGPELRIGASITRGPYLNADLAPLLPSTLGWADYQQTVATFDGHYSAGRFDNRVEVALSRYDVPTVAAPVNGLGWYAESRATLTPRLFVAARFEHNRYPFVQPVSREFWVGTATTQMNGEIGVGYRLNPDALLKASVRRDHWPVHQVGATAFPDGYAVALQFSVHADLVQLLNHKP